MRHFSHHEDDKLFGKTFDSALLKRMLPYIVPHTWMLAYCLLLMTALAVASIIEPVLVRLAIDLDISNGDSTGLILRAASLAGILCCAIFLTWALTVNLETIGQRILRTLRMELFRKLLFMPVRYYNENPVGRLVARVESDTEAVRVFFTSTTVMLAQNLFMLFGIVAIMYISSPGMTVRIVFVIPLLLIATYFFMRKVRPLFLGVRRKVADICAFVTEHMQGMKVVQSFNQQERVAVEMDRENREKFETQYPAEKLVIWFWNGVTLTEFVAIGIALWYGSRAALSGAITVGLVVMFISYIQKFYAPIRMISDQVNVMQRAFAAGERIFGILSTKSEILDPPEPRVWPKFDCEIKFEHVWFCYKPDEWVLKDVSFTIPKGQTWALVGPTGSGKTTIIALLLRFYDPQKGRITVDGIDIRDLTQNSLREKFSLVQQDIFLFPGSVLDNLRLMDDTISEERVWNALKHVQAEKIVQSMPDGIKTELAERGANLSQGERQLLSFARALVFDPQIFLLDEATSSVDPATERKIQIALDKILEGRTGIIVAHRLATIRRADNILVLVDGELCESGKHADLLAAGGKYASMHYLQFENNIHSEDDHV